MTDYKVDPLDELNRKASKYAITFVDEPTDIGYDTIKIRYAKYRDNIEAAYYLLRNDHEYYELAAVEKEFVSDLRKQGFKIYTSEVLFSFGPHKDNFLPTDKLHDLRNMIEQYHVQKQSQQRSSYGSNSLDEMRERMRSAGYEEWEINEEIKGFEWSLDHREKNTRHYAETGEYIPTTPRVLQDRTVSSNESLEIKDAAEAKGKTIEIPMAFTVFGRGELTVPESISSMQELKAYVADNIDDIVLPKHMSECDLIDDSIEIDYPNLEELHEEQFVPIAKSEKQKSHVHSPKSILSASVIKRQSENPTPKDAICEAKQNIQHKNSSSLSKAVGK